MAELREVMEIPGAEAAATHRAWAVAAPRTTDPRPVRERFAVQIDAARAEAARAARSGAS